MILFIVNEQSGNGRGKQAWSAVERRMHEIGCRSDYVKIAAKNEVDAIREAEAMTTQGGITALIAVGGDGTLHALLPLAVRCQLPLGLIPCGSGNDTARAFGLPRHPIAALEIALNGQTQRVDLLRSAAQPAEPALRPEQNIRASTSGLTRQPARLPAQPRLTLTCIASGLDGAVAADVNGSRYKRWCNRLGIGTAAYIIGLFRTLARFKPQTVTVTVDGAAREFRRCWLTAIANTPAYGGGLRICPTASPSDGRLQVCVVNGCSALQLLLLFPTVFFGKHVRSRFVTMLAGTNVAIRSPFPFSAYGDGEPVGSTPLDTEILSGQLLILTSCSGYRNGSTISNTVPLPISLFALIRPR